MDMEQRVGRVHRFGSRKTIIVETLVVKDSREEHAYRVAREKLRMITATMVEPERFEQIFSRVMCLVPSEELQNILANDPVAPLTAIDQETLGKAVQEGFAAWQDFDKRFAESQKQIRLQDPGLSTWNDVAGFLQTYGKWKPVEGFTKQKFAWKEGELASVEEAANVIVSPDGRFFACSDQGGIPIAGPSEERTEQLGLNLPDVRQVLCSAVFPPIPCGAFYVRWPNEATLPTTASSDRFAVFAFMRQSVRTDAQSGWIEAGLSLHMFFMIGEAVVPVDGQDRRLIVDGLIRSTPRVKSPTVQDILEKLVEKEDELKVGLQRPTEDEMSAGTRHAVWPLACGIIDFDK
jgi:hypothetical protein